MKVSITTWLIFLILGAVSAGWQNDDYNQDDNDYDPPEGEFGNRGSRGRGSAPTTVVVPEGSTVIIVRDRKRPNYDRRYDDEYDSTYTNDYDYRDRPGRRYEDLRSSERGRGRARPRRPNRKFEQRDGRKPSSVGSASPPVNAAKPSTGGQTTKNRSDKAQAGSGGLLNALKIG